MPSWSVNILGVPAVLCALLYDVVGRLTRYRNPSPDEGEEPKLAMGDCAQALLERNRIRFLDNLVFPHQAINAGQGARQGDSGGRLNTRPCPAAKGSPAFRVHAKCRMAC